MNFNNLKAKLQQFFYGRYGNDSLNIFLIVLSLIIYNIPYIWLLNYLLLGFAVFRTLSKNIYKRQKELEIYNNIIGHKINKLLKNLSQGLKRLIYNTNLKVKKYKTMQSEKEHYLFFKCKICKKTLKVPKNKGTLKVTCPICKNIIFKKT